MAGRIYLFTDRLVCTINIVFSRLFMTELLERAFAKAAKLSSDEQDLLASRVLAEMADEDEFDHAIAASADKLASLANEALAEHRAGQTQELDPDRL
jgi:hypothetical protein